MPSWRTSKAIPEDKSLPIFSKIFYAPGARPFDQKLLPCSKTFFLQFSLQ